MKVPKTFVPEKKNFDEDIKEIISKDLTDKIREALIERRAKEDYQRIQNPRYQEITRRFIEVLGDSFSDEETSKKVKEKAYSQVESTFNNTKKGREKAHKIAQRQYKTRKDIDLELDELYEKLEIDQSVGSEKFRELQEANEGRYLFFDNQNRIIACLVKIAEEEGIEKALAKETHYEAIRHVFPTASEFIDHHLKAYESTVQHFAKLVELKSKGPQTDESIFEIEMLEGYRRGFVEVEADLTKEIAYEEAKKVYGKEVDEL